MNASKETARETLRLLGCIVQDLIPWSDDACKVSVEDEKRSIQFVKDFLEAAIRKLPKESSFLRPKSGAKKTK